MKGGLHIIKTEKYTKKATIQHTQSLASPQLPMNVIQDIKKNWVQVFMNEVHSKHIMNIQYIQNIL